MTAARESALDIPGPVEDTDARDRGKAPGWGERPRTAVVDQNRLTPGEGAGGITKGVRVFERRPGL